MDHGPPQEKEWPLPLDGPALSRRDVDSSRFLWSRPPFLCPSLRDVPGLGNSSSWDPPRSSLLPRPFEFEVPFFAGVRPWLLREEVAGRGFLAPPRM